MYTPLRRVTCTDYDLVRIYHPDSPAALAGGTSPDAAHARFQAIASAYATLSGKKPAALLDGEDAGSSGPGAARSSYHALSTAMWRARQQRRAELDVGLDERWKERMMAGAILLVRLPIPRAERRASILQLKCACSAGYRAIRTSNVYNPDTGHLGS